MAQDEKVGGRIRSEGQMESFIRVLEETGLADQVGLGTNIYGIMVMRESPSLKRDSIGWLQIMCG